MVATNAHSAALDSLNFNASEAKIHSLKKPDEVFQNSCTREEIRRFLETEDEDQNNTYFITDYRTLQDARLIEESSRSSGAHIQA